MKGKSRSWTKWGTGTLGAWFRQGLRELRALFYPESNIAQQTEYGMYGTRTPGEVAQSRRESARDMDEERESILSERMKQTDARDDREREDPEKERD